MYLRILPTLFAALLAGPAHAAAPAVATTETAAPALAVVISVDQLRADLVLRFRPHYGEGGFARLLAEGADFRSTRYHHATTKTAPGHATILTGVPPAVHGIFANEWIGAGGGPASVPSVTDTEAPLVGRAEAGRSPGGVIEAQAGRSPRNLLAPTVGDQLKLRFGDRCRVIAIADKDRSAILLGGKLADAAYWLESGRFISSRYYAPALPAWLTTFNAAKKADAAHGATWDRLLPEAAYLATQGPDTAPGETTAFMGFGPTLPKTITGGHEAVTADFYEAFEASPLANTLVTDVVLEALRHEKLGHHDGPDLLAISYSQPDLAGHLYGPDSHEMMDSILRLDRELARLFAAFDHEVGPGKWIAVLTADHGAAPLPERVQALSGGNRLAAGRVDLKRLDQSVTAALELAFGAVAAPQRWAIRDNNGYRLYPDLLATRNVTAAAAATVIRDAVLKAPEVAAAWTRAEILALPMTGTDIPTLVRRGYPPSRGTDVVYVFKPYFIDRSKAGTTHGMPYDYDQHVPQLWIGPGISTGVHLEPVSVEDIAPTLSGLLGVTPPPDARGRRLL